MSTPGPRLFGIPATSAPIVAVIRRGPSDWCAVGRWDIEGADYEPGAWFRGTLYPQKCDLSPDGRWFAYSAMKPGADWAAGDIYEAVARLPWLTALAAWNAGTTYTRGMHFTEVPGSNEIGEPDVGDAGPLMRRLGLALYRPVQFAVERRRGWVESPGTPPREAGGNFDEGREVTMEKPHPGGSNATLRVSGSYAAFRTSPDVRSPALYELDCDGTTEPLGDVQWADWDKRGRLLVATRAGVLQVREIGAEPANVVFEADLANATPDPQPPPAWANEW